MKDEKILQDEILSDEQLENVVGGGANQTQGDSDFLNKLGYNHKSRNSWGYIDHMSVTRAWGVAGIACKAYYIGDDFDNEYYLEGKKISRKDAFKHAMQKRGWSQAAIDCFDWDDVDGKF